MPPTDTDSGGGDRPHNGSNSNQKRVESKEKEPPGSSASDPPPNPNPLNAGLGEDKPPAPTDNAEKPNLPKEPLKPEPKKLLTWNEVLADDGFKSEVALPEVSKSVTNEDWKHPKTLLIFSTKPELELALLYSKAEGTTPLPLIPQSGSRDIWDITATLASGAPKQLATIDFNTNGTALQFHWAMSANNEARDVIEDVRGAVLQLRLKGAAETKTISFLPALPARVPFPLNVDQLINNGSWTVPLPDELRIPNGQISAAYVRLSEFGTERDEREKSVVLATDGSEVGSEVVEIGIDQLNLKIKYVLSKESHPTLSILLQGSDDVTGQDMLFPKWLSKNVSRRKQLLEDAIVYYRRQLVGILNAPVENEELIRKSLPKKLADLVKMETEGFETVKAHGNPKHPLARYAPLQAYQEKYGDPSQLSRELRKLLSKAQVSVRITRCIKGSPEESTQKAPELVVFEAK